MSEYLLRRRVGHPLLAKPIVAALALLALTGCGATIYRPGPTASELRKALDELNATRATSALDVTDAVLKFVPLGTPEKQAVDIIANAGIPLRRKDRYAAADRIPDPSVKSDYQLYF